MTDSNDQPTPNKDAQNTTPDAERVKRDLERRLSALTDRIRENPEQFKEQVERGLGDHPDETLQKMAQVQRQLETKMGEVAETAGKTLDRRPQIPGKLIVDAEALDRVSEQFKGHGKTLEQVIQTIETKLRMLQSASGHELFKEEIKELILPTLRYLKSGLDAWTSQVAQIAGNYRTTSEKLQKQQTQLAALQEMQRKLQNHEYDTPEDETPNG